MAFPLGPKEASTTLPFSSYTYEENRGSNFWNDTMRHALVAGMLVLILTCTQRSEAGLYYSGENLADLPSQWRGFLLDQRALRGIAAKPGPKLPASPLRVKYEAEAAKLEKLAKERKLTADEQADLGAIFVRLGDLPKALRVLTAAYRERPHHFHIVANLGTAWHLQGDLAQAATHLQEAVRLAPGKLQRAEEHHLKLVRLRQRQGPRNGDWEDLFGIRYQGTNGDYNPGLLNPAEKKKLSYEVVAIAQQLAIWLPADGRLLWQLAEMANAYGDVRMAAAMMDGCVTEFGMHAPELRRHRQVLRTAADELARQPQAGDAKGQHNGPTIAFQPRSKRPLVVAFDTVDLPPVSLTGVNPVPWSLFADTSVGRQFNPKFPKYLLELNDKQVSITGFMQPLGGEDLLDTFMFIEYAVGCWHCEMPELTQIIFVELPMGKKVAYGPELLKITGRLVLNSTDPESFLFVITDAKVGGAD